MRWRRGGILLATLACLVSVRATYGEPLKTVHAIAPPLKYGAWIEMKASSGERGYEISVEITNDAATQVYGEAMFTNKVGEQKTITFSDGSPAKFRTGNYFATIKVRVKTGGPTGAAVAIIQK